MAMAADSSTPMVTSTPDPIADLQDKMQHVQMVLQSHHLVVRNDQGNLVLPEGLLGV